VLKRVGEPEDLGAPSVDGYEAETDGETERPAVEEAETPVVEGIPAAAKAEDVFVPATQDEVVEEVGGGVEVTTEHEEPILSDVQESGEPALGIKVD